MIKFSIVSLSFVSFLLSQSSLQAMEQVGEKAVKARGKKSEGVPKHGKGRRNFGARLVEEQNRQNTVAGLKLKNRDIERIIRDYEAGQKTLFEKQGVIVSLKIPKDSLGTNVTPYLTPEYVEAFTEHKAAGSESLSKLLTEKGKAKSGISDKLIPAISEKPIIANHFGATVLEHCKQGIDSQGQLRYLSFKIKRKGQEDLPLESIIDLPDRLQGLHPLQIAISITQLK